MQSSHLAALFLVPFVIIRLFNSLENHFPIINLIRQIRLYQKPQFQVVYRTSFHCLQILYLINFCPVRYFPQTFFEDHVQPDSRASAIALHKRVCHIHFHILCDDFLKCVFRHLLYCRKNCI